MLLNNKTSLFCNGKCLNYSEKYLHYGIWRIMWEGKQGRIIIYADLPSQESDILEDGQTLELRYYECGRMDDPNGGFPIFYFSNIQLKRQWIPKPNPLFAESEIITKFSEYYCDIVELRQVH